MKTWVFLILALFVAACQNNDGGGGGTTTTTVTTPLTNCIDGTSYCNNSAYAQNQGWMAYPGMYGYAYNYMNYFTQNGFCNCPAGYNPTYNSSYGLGCVQTRLLQPYSGYYMYWQLGAGATWSSGWGYANAGYGYNSGYGYGYNNGYYDGGYYSAPTYPNNYPQYSNIPNGSYGGNNGGSCSRNLTQSCLINQANTCSNGATCRQVVSGSNLGVCANY